MATQFQTREEALKGRKWQLVDAEGVALGRLASEVAGLIRGKHRSIFSPHVDGGDFVVVVNAAKVKLTGAKLTGKHYYHHSGYMGGLSTIAAERMLATHPDRLIKHAVKGMLPKGRLGHQLNNKLKVFAGPEHNHQAQKPEPYALRCMRVKKA